VSSLTQIIKEKIQLHICHNTCQYHLHTNVVKCPPAFKYPWHLQWCTNKTRFWNTLQLLWKKDENVSRILLYPIIMNYNNFLPITHSNTFFWKTNKLGMLEYKSYANHNFFSFFFETGSCNVAQASFKVMILLLSLPSTGITGMPHHAQPK
jgi:hypothetical protein